MNSPSSSISSLIPSGSIPAPLPPIDSLAMSKPERKPGENSISDVAEAVLRQSSTSVPPSPLTVRQQTERYLLAKTVREIGWDTEANQARSLRVVFFCELMKLSEQVKSNLMRELGHNMTKQTAKTQDLRTSLFDIFVIVRTIQTVGAESILNMKIPEDKKEFEMQKAFEGSCHLSQQMAEFPWLKPILLFLKLNSHLSTSIGSLCPKDAPPHPISKRNHFLEIANAYISALDMELHLFCASCCTYVGRL